ncbi:hypothetical protein [Pendulispora albinea]|uniref:Uncharacterized protein n=1 Tax=Pendulispora albinea TaxID=2741071 RepID=A0ABZ2LWM9_9BACT
MGILVDFYPTSIAATLKPFPSDDYGGFSEGFCADIREKAMNVRDKGKEAAKNDYYAVRGSVVDSYISLTVPVSPLVGTAFRDAVEKAARRTGAPGSSFILHNELSLDSVQLRVEFDPDAISQITRAAMRARLISDSKRS